MNKFLGFFGLALKRDMQEALDMQARYLLLIDKAIAERNQARAERAKTVPDWTAACNQELHAITARLPAVLEEVTA